MRNYKTEKNNLLRMITINVNFSEIGDAHLIIVPNGKTMLIDAGLLTYGTQVILPFLKQHGIRTIDWLMVSHPHYDHIEGIPELIRSEDVKVKQLLWSTIPFEKMDKLENYCARQSQDLIEAIKLVCEECNISIHEVTKDENINMGEGVKIEILAVAEPNQEVSNYINNNSIVMQLKYDKFLAMFTGDQGFEQEQRVIASGRNLTSDVLHVAHHAGAGSTSVEWVKAVSPKIAIASMPKWLSSDERGLRVYNLLSSFGITLYRTWESGNIEIQSDGSQFWVLTSSIYRREDKETRVESYRHTEGNNYENKFI